jgi:hypothetical protein
MTTVYTGLIRVRHDTLANFESANPVLKYGEIAVAFDGATPKIKVGNAAEDTWNNLPWASAGGGTGTDGKSAYEIAVDNGYTGDEPSWLESLKGENGDPGQAAPAVFIIAISDETTAITSGTAKTTFRMPYAMTLTSVRASLTTAQASGSLFTIDINKNGSSILSTKITIDNSEKSSTSALTQPVISDSTLADDNEISIDVDQIGDGSAKGCKVTLIGQLV